MWAQSVLDKIFAKQMTVSITTINLWELPLMNFELCLHNIRVAESNLNFSAESRSQIMTPDSDPDPTLGLCFSRTGIYKGLKRFS